MRIRIVVALFALLLMAQADTNFNPNVSPSATSASKTKFNPVAVPPFSLHAFADKLEEALRDKCAGYQFVVSFNDQSAVKRAGGAARRSPDPSPRAMTVDDRYNVASVSKTITAAAALKLLRDKNISIDSRMSKYLPKSFTIGPNVETITFRQLLTHRSGILCGGNTRAELETCIAAGVQAGNIGDYEYANGNFALFRFLIPEVEDFSRFSSQDQQMQMAKDYPARYMAYVQKTVFDPAGLPTIRCKPSLPRPALCYQFPCPDGPGDDFGDSTEKCGAKGWNLSSAQLATLVSALMYTEKILPQDLRERMKTEQLGLFRNSVEGGVVNDSHGGYLPGKHEDGTNHNNGELNSLIYGLSNGVSVAMIVNSQYSLNKDLYKMVQKAAKEMIP